MKRGISLAILTGLFALGALAGIYFTSGGMRTPASAIYGTVLDPPRGIADFSLLDQHGKAFDRNALQGNWTMMFFGYAHCPDVCPTTLQTLVQVKRRLGDAWAPRIVFVSVDPERDTPDKLAAYLGYFDPAIIGLVGERAKLEAFTRDLGIMHMKGETRPDGGYLVDHTASVLLLDPRAELRALFSAPHDAARIADEFLQIRKM
jgi:protein SCO1/2